MDQKLRLRRLNKLYADLDVPAFKPVEQGPETRQRSESLPVLLQEQQPVVFLLRETDQNEIKDSDETVQDSDRSNLSLLADPHPDIIFPKIDGIESTTQNETFSVLDVSALPVEAIPGTDVAVLRAVDQNEIEDINVETDFPDVATLPTLDDPGQDALILPEMDEIKSVASSPEEVMREVSALPLISDPIPESAPVVSPVHRPLKHDEPRQADWKAIGIGAATGTLVSGILLLAALPMHIFSHPGQLVLWGGEMFLGVIGALLANSWKSTTRELWRAAITWTLYPVWFALLIGLIYLLLTFTSLTG